MMIMSMIIMIIIIIRCECVVQHRLVVDVPHLHDDYDDHHDYDYDSNHERNEAARRLVDEPMLREGVHVREQRVLRRL